MSNESISNPETDGAQKTGGFRLIYLLPVAVFALLASIFLSQLFSGRDISEIPSALIDRPAPDFELAGLDGLVDKGEPIPGLSRADLAGGVSIVNVFASWCAPCRDEHPLLVELARDGRFRVFGINYKDDPGNALRFLNALGNPYSRVGTDPSGRTGIDWGVYGVPETFVVDARGVIVAKYVGPLSPEGIATRLMPAIEKALGTTPPAS